MGREHDQLLGHMVHAAQGRRLGRALAVAVGTETGEHRWLVLGRWPWPRRLRAVPLGLVRWSDSCGLQVPVSEAQVVDSPALDADVLDAHALRRLQRFWDEACPR